MDTLFGLLSIAVNGKSVDFIPTEMLKKVRHFQVDNRYRIDLPNIRHVGEETIITCLVASLKHDCFGPSTGEELAQVTFEGVGKKMCIGTIGDIEGIEYSYPDYGIQLAISKSVPYTDFVFIIAWCESALADTDSTTFLTDPTWGSGDSI